MSQDTGTKCQLDRWTPVIKDPMGLSHVANQEATCPMRRRTYGRQVGGEGDVDFPPVAP